MWKIVVHYKGGHIRKYTIDANLPDAYSYDVKRTILKHCFLEATIENGKSLSDIHRLEAYQ